MFEDVQGRVAVITGGARGLGLGMARALAAWGVRPALLDVLPEVGTASRALAKEHSVDSLGVHADVADHHSIAEAFAEVERALGLPTILVNAAGVSAWEDSVDVSAESWQRVIDINLTGTFLCCQALARGCLAAGRPGTIVNISSMSGRVVNVPQHQTAYNVSKAGVDMLTKSLAVEWAPAGIRVNAIAPGYILTDMTRRLTLDRPELAQRWTQLIPLGRMGEPADLDALVVFLCSQRSSYIVGETVVIDGAYTAV